MNYPEIKHLTYNPDMEGQVKLVQDVIYSDKTGEKLPLSLLLPWNLDSKRIHAKKKPLIVFVQGSAWTTADREFELPQLSAFARKGYIVATIEHRSAIRGHAFPAFLQDVKCAIRFLRKNADLYGIDPEKVAIWGTSSGGNAALLTGLTMDAPEYKTEEYAEYSDSVNAVVGCFSPTDLIAMQDVILPPVEDRSVPPELALGLCGGDISRYNEVAVEMSPVYQVKKEKKVPPFLLMHGDNDPLVPFEQMTSLYHKMVECDYDVEAWQVEGAVHEANFWSDAVYHVIEDFLMRKI